MDVNEWEMRVRMVEIDNRRRRMTREEREAEAEQRLAELELIAEIGPDASRQVPDD